MERVELPVDIRVKQVKGVVSFEFMVEDTRWWSKHTSMVPIKIQTFTIGQDEPGAIWEIIAQGSHPGIEHVPYAIVPEGFKQLTPINGDPPKLKNGQEYFVFVPFGGTRFVYEGEK